MSSRSRPFSRRAIGKTLVLMALAIHPVVAEKQSDTMDSDELAASNNNWMQWRGPLGTGEAPNAAPPIDWSESQNVRWKTRLPGLGHSTPVVFGDHVFVTTAIPSGPSLPPKFSGAPGAHDNLPVTSRHKFVGILLDRKSGEIVWQKELAEALPHEGGHRSGSLASASPATDGKHLFAYFGSYGLFCLDMQGNVIWNQSLGLMNTKHGHGEGSSPAVYDGTIVVNQDHEKQSFVAAFDVTTGKEKWRVKRDEVTSWSSPLIVTVDGKPQVVVPGTVRVRGYDLATGDIIWECGGLSANVVATPVFADGIVYVASSYDTRAMMAIRLAKAAGDITDTDHVVWSRTDRTPYVPSPLLYKSTLYFLRHYQGILSQVEAATGNEPIGPVRLSQIRNVYASPVAAADRIYVTDLEGVTTVVSHGVPRILANNRLDDEIAASLAIAGDEIFIRGKNHLYCIATTDSAER